jgi:hypothetical protein
MSPEEFAEGFGGFFDREAYRLELLDAYVAPNEDAPLRRFLSGEMPDPAWREPWKRFVRKARAAGKQMARVHVVTEPLTPYLRFELECAYPANVEAGEAVLILERPVAGSLDLPSRDYWLFDSAQAALMDYDSAGNWLNVEIADDPATIAFLCRARDLALAHAIPLNTYLIKEKERYGRRAS